MTRTGKRAAYALVGGTLAYNVIEGVVAIASGIEARSVVLVSFGFDSYLEVAAAAAVLWRLSAPSEEVGEERALRVIGASFMLLALGVFLQATLALGERTRGRGVYGWAGAAGAQPDGDARRVLREAVGGSAVGCAFAGIGGARDDRVLLPEPDRPRRGGGDGDRRVVVDRCGVRARDDPVARARGA
jgi:hypothetical protein